MSIEIAKENNMNLENWLSSSNAYLDIGSYHAFVECRCLCSECQLQNASVSHIEPKPIARNINKTVANIHTIGCPLNFVPYRTLTIKSSQNKLLQPTPHHS